MSVRCLIFNILYPETLFCAVRTIWGSSKADLPLVFFALSCRICPRHPQQREITKRPLFTTPRVSPLRGSLEAVPTCCDGLRHTTASTLDFMVGQEYHDPFRLLSPCGLQSRIYRQVVSLGRLYHNCRRAPTDVAAEFIARQRKERI